MSFCSGSSTTLDAGLYASYLWSTGATTRTINVSTAGTFTVTVTDANGCTGSSSVTTIINSLPTPSISGILSFCSGSSTTLDAGLYNSYLWSTGATTRTINVSTAGTFIVTVTNSNGCTGNTSAITTLLTPTINAGSDVTICQGNSTTLNASGGSSYSWTVVDTLQQAPIINNSNTSLIVGLRKLVASYSGPAIQLRRSSDNATANFGFVGNALDTAAINLWLGSSMGYCTIIYDQSGNGRNITQVNANSQPTLLLNNLNGKPVLRFDNTRFMSNLTAFSNPYTVIYSARQNGPNRQRILSSINNNWLLGWWSGGRQQAFFEGWINPNPGLPIANSDATIYTGSGNGIISKVYENGTLLNSSSVGLAAPNGIQINGFNFTEQSDCDFMELLVFNTVLSDSVRSQIEYNIGSVYNIGFSSVAQLLVNPNTTTSYVLTGISTNGCVGRDTITVNVNPKPIITCLSDTIVFTDNDACSQIVNFGTPTTLGNGPFTYSYSQNPNTLFNVGNTNVVVSATDVNGCINSCSFNIALKETIAPTISCPGNIVTYSNIVNYPAPAATDNCVNGIVLSDSITFNYTGSTQTYVVPAGVSLLYVEANGAQGGSNVRSGGLGGKMASTIPVTPGQVLNIVVGGAGSNSFSRRGAGGGGFSGVLNGTTHILSAGGGGGANGDEGCGGGGNGGSGGGSSGENGTNGPCGTGGLGGQSSLTPLVGLGGSAQVSGSPGTISGGGIGGAANCADLGTGGGGGSYGLLGAVQTANCGYGGGGDGGFGGGGSGGSEGVGGVLQRLSGGGGGGGGYSAGAGGNNGTGCSSCGAGGGGGGNNYNLYPSPNDISLQGINSGNGLVKIEAYGNINIDQTNGYASGSYFPFGTTSNTFVATDVGGNTDSCTFTVTVIDSVKPTISCPANMVVANTLGNCSAVVNYQLPSAIDNSCLPSNAFLSYDLLGTFNGKLYLISKQTKTWVNAKAEAASFGLKLVSITSAAENNFLASFGQDFLIGLSDQVNEGTWLWESGEPYSYTNWNPGEPNNSGNEDFVQMFSNGKWNDLPISVASKYVVESDCNLNTVLTAGPTSGSVFPLGTTVVSYSASDPSGNTSACSFNITVEDREAPVLVCSNVIDTVFADPGTCVNTSYVLQSPTVTDNCNVFTLTNDYPTSTFYAGMNIINWTATDSSGNSSTCTKRVFVYEPTVPTISCPAPITVNNDAGICGARVIVNPTVADNCSSSSIDSITYNYSGNTELFIVPDGVTSMDITGIGAAGGASGSNPGGKGASMSGKFIVTPGDTLYINVGQMGQISGGGGGGTFISKQSNSSRTLLLAAGAGGGGGNYGVGDALITTNGANGGPGDYYGVSAGGTFSNGGVGNIAGGGAGWNSNGGNTECYNGGFSILNGGNGGQSCYGSGNGGYGGGGGAYFSAGGGGGGYSGGGGGDYNTCCDLVSYGGGGGSYNAGSNQSNVVGVGDSNGLVKIRFEKNFPYYVLVSGVQSGEVFPVGTTTNVYKVIDASGNIDSCSTTITVNDTEAPVVHLPSNITISTIGDSCSKVVNYNKPYVTDNCCILPTSLPNYIYLGTFEAHTYFQSSNNLTWTDAKLAAESLGGQLASINSATENLFLKNTAVGGPYVGGFQNTSSPLYSEPSGGWEWLDGTPFNAYTNWNPGEPNNSGGENYLQIGNGGWNDLYNTSNSYIVEFACGITPTLIAGLPSGSAFPIGTTTVTYSAIDPNGLTSTSSFNITVTDNRPNLNITALGATTFCLGDSVKLEADTGYVSYSWSNGTTTNSTTALINGLYTVTATTLNGCTKTASLNVNVIDCATASCAGTVTVSQTTICVGDTAVPYFLKFGSVFPTTWQIRKDPDTTWTNIGTDDSLSTGTPPSIGDTGVYHARAVVLGTSCIDSISNEVTITVLNCNPTITLNVKAFLQGFYIGGGQMTPVLFNTGVSTDPTECDTITIELRDPLSTTTVIYSVQTILHVDGNSVVTLPSTLLNQSYYIVLRHRNSIETWSKSPVLLNSSTVTFDFTAP